MITHRLAMHTKGWVTLPQLLFLASIPPRAVAENVTVEDILLHSSKRWCKNQLGPIHT